MYQFKSSLLNIATRLEFDAILDFFISRPARYYQEKIIKLMNIHTRCSYKQKRYPRIYIMLSSEHL